MALKIGDKEDSRLCKIEDVELLSQADQVRAYSKCTGCICHGRDPCIFQPGLCGFRQGRVRTRIRVRVLRKVQVPDRLDYRNSAFVSLNNNFPRAQRSVSPGSEKVEDGHCTHRPRVSRTAEVRSAVAEPFHILSWGECAVLVIPRSVWVAGLLPTRWYTLRIPHGAMSVYWWYMRRENRSATTNDTNIRLILQRR